MTHMPVPMSSPDIGTTEREAVARVLDGSYLSNGPITKEFEDSFARAVGRNHAVSVSSGTSGLHLCVIAAGVEAGDLVVTPPFSFVASANAIMYESAIPIFVDVDPEDGNIDPVQMEAAVNALQGSARDAAQWLPPNLRSAEMASFGSRLKAILPIHVFGQPFDARNVRAVADRYELVVIEDACEAVGAEYGDGKAGTMGHSSVFAFYPNKQMTTGEGGMIVTDSEDDAALFRSLRNQGRDVFDAWLTHSRVGFNYRMDELSAALGLAQLARLDELLAKRDQVASWYAERLADTEGIEIPPLPPSVRRMSWFVYVVRLPDGRVRDGVMRRLEMNEIPSRPYFPPIHLQAAYVDRFGWSPGAFPVAEDLGSRSLALPFSGVMTEEQVDRVAGGIRDALQELN